MPFPSMSLRLPRVFFCVAAIGTPGGHSAPSFSVCSPVCETCCGWVLTPVRLCVRVCWARQCGLTHTDARELRLSAAGFPVLQEGCLPPLRLLSSRGRSRASSSMTRPQGPRCRTQPACTRRRLSSPAGWPRPASPPRPCQQHCSSHSRPSRPSRRRRRCHPPRPPRRPPPVSTPRPRSPRHWPCT